MNRVGDHRGLYLSTSEHQRNLRRRSYNCGMADEKQTYRYLVHGMGSVQMITLSCPIAVGQYWTWVCEQNPTLEVPGFGVTMGDTFRVDSWKDGEEPPADLNMQDLSRRYRTCIVSFAGNKNLDSSVPNATGLIEYRL